MQNSVYATRPLTGTEGIFPQDGYDIHPQFPQFLLNPRSPAVVPMVTIGSELSELLRLLVAERGSVEALTRREMVLASREKELEDAMATKVSIDASEEQVDKTQSTHAEINADLGKRVLEVLDQLNDAREMPAWSADIKENLILANATITQQGKGMEGLRNNISVLSGTHTALQEEIRQLAGAHSTSIELLQGLAASHDTLVEQTKANDNLRCTIMLQELTAAKTQLVTISALNATLQEEKDRLLLEIDNRCTISSSATEHVERLTKTVLELTAKSDKMAEDLSHKEQISSSATEHVERLKKTVLELTAKSDKMAEDLSHKEQMLVSANSRCITLHKVKGRLQMEIDNVEKLQKTVLELTAKCDKMAEDLSHKEQAVFSANSSYITLHEEKDRLQMEINKVQNLKKTVLELTTKSDKMAKDLSGKEQMLVSAHSSSTSCRALNDRLSDENDRLQTKVSALTASIEQLQANVVQLTKGSDGWERKTNEMGQDLRTITGERDALQVTIDRLTSLNLTLETSREELRASIARCADQERLTELLRAQNRDLSTQCITAHQLASDLRGQIHNHARDRTSGWVAVLSTIFNGACLIMNLRFLLSCGPVPVDMGLFETLMWICGYLLRCVLISDEALSGVKLVTANGDIPRRWAVKARSLMIFILIGVGVMRFYYIETAPNGVKMPPPSPAVMAPGYEADHSPPGFSVIITHDIESPSGAMHSQDVFNNDSGYIVCDTFDLNETHSPKHEWFITPWQVRWGGPTLLFAIIILSIVTFRSR